MKPNFLKTKLAMACGALLVANVAVADGATVLGLITNGDSSVYFEGATVTIKELNKSVVAERGGLYRFNDIPSGDYTLVISYLGVEPVEQKVTVTQDKLIQKNIELLGLEDAAIEEVVAFGQRGGQAGAINKQRNSDKLISVVSADAIGQLPDQNASEALQRLPGMFIERDQGEGRFVGIRGIDPNLNNVSINGVNVPSPETGIRSVALDVVPSELISSLEVSKTVTPDMDANAIGGSVEVKSLSAFDRGEQSYSVSFTGSHNELTGDTSPKASASFTDLFDFAGQSDSLGVAAAVSYYSREFGSDNMETDGGWSEVSIEDENENEIDTGITGAGEIELRSYKVKRERLGAALNFDFKPDFSNHYYWRTLFSKFSDDEFRERSEYKFEDGDLDLTTFTARNAAVTGGEMDRDTKDRYEEQTIFSTVVGAEHRIDEWTVEYQASLSKSDETEPDRVDVDFKGEGFDMGYTSVNSTPAVYADAGAFDAANFELDEIVFEDNKTEDEEFAIKFDITRELEFGDYFGAVKFGAKYRQREKISTPTTNIYEGGWDDVTLANFSNSNVDYGLGRFGPSANEGQLRSWFFQNQSGFELAAQDSYFETWSATYEVEEDVLATYAMVTADIDNLTVIAGVRYESTEFTTTGFDVAAGAETAPERVTVSKDYDHFLPSLNLRYEFSDELIGRAAYTQTIARPTFDDAKASRVREDDEAEIGNPQLDPYESQNLDFSVEYYPGDIGVLSAGVFFKQIDNFIYRSVEDGTGDFADFELTIQRNGEQADVSGLELNWTKNFDFGLFISTNATLTESEATYIIDGEAVKDSLVNQADQIGNFTVGFENDMVSLRLTASHKSYNINEFDDEVRIYEDDHNQLDFSAKYHVNDQLNVHFNMINITDEPFYAYYGEQQYNYQYEEYGRTFELGVTYTSF